MVDGTERYEAGKRLLLNRIGTASLVVLVTAVCGGAILAGTWLLHARASAQDNSEPNPPVAVETDVFNRQPDYQVIREFIGRIEPTRETELAFELSGTVHSVEVDEGDAVEAGSPIAQLDQARLRSRLGELAAEREELAARLALARATAQRQATLKNQGWTAEQRFDEARFEVKRLEAAISRVGAAVETLKVDLEKSILKSPFAGRIASRSIDEGAIVSAGTPVMTVLETGSARVRVGVARDVGQNLKTGAMYSLRADDQSFEARLIALRPDLEPQSRTVTALFATDGKLPYPFGTVVALNVPRTVTGAGGWVPLSALSEGQKGVWSLMVVVETGGNTVVRREAVTLLHVSNGQAFVQGSLPDGSRYIVNGTNRITPGQRVAYFIPR